MRYWHSIVLFAQEYPPRFVEILMLFLSLILLVIWGFGGDEPYLILSLSYSIGSSVSILLREYLRPSANSRLNQITGVILLITSIYGFIDIKGNF